MPSLSEEYRQNLNQQIRLQALQLIESIGREYSSFVASAYSTRKKMLS